MNENKPDNEALVPRPADGIDDDGTDGDSGLAELGTLIDRVPGLMELSHKHQMEAAARNMELAEKNAEAARADADARLQMYRESQQQRHKEFQDRLEVEHKEQGNRRNLAYALVAAMAIVSVTMVIEGQVDKVGYIVAILVPGLIAIINRGPSRGDPPSADG